MQSLMRSLGILYLMKFGIISYEMKLCIVCGTSRWFTCGTVLCRMLKANIVFRFPLLIYWGYVVLNNLSLHRQRWRTTKGGSHPYHRHRSVMVKNQGCSWFVKNTVTLAGDSNELMIAFRVNYTYVCQRVER